MEIFLKIISNRYRTVTQNCSSCETGHFLAIKPKSGTSEIGKGEKANQEIKQMLK